MTITNFKAVVAGYLNRDPGSFIVNSQDMILQAMNDARRDAQLAHQFELCRTEDAYLETDIGGTNWMTECKTTPGGDECLTMRRIDEVWNYVPVVVGSDTIYARSTRVDFGYTGQFKRSLPTVDGIWVTNQIQQNFQSIGQFAYANGSKLFMNRITTPTIYKLVGIQLLPDLSGAETSDIFLTHFTNWFKYATILALNVYLKDTERFPLDARIVDRTFELVKSMDGSIANMGESMDLS